MTEMGKRGMGSLQTWVGGQNRLEYETPGDSRGERSSLLASNGAAGNDGYQNSSTR